MYYILHELKSLYPSERSETENTFSLSQSINFNRNAVKIAWHFIQSFSLIHIILFATCCESVYKCSRKILGETLRVGNAVRVLRLIKNMNNFSTAYLQAANQLQCGWITNFQLNRIYSIPMHTCIHKFQCARIHVSICEEKRKFLNSWAP